LKVTDASLNRTRCLIGSQCNSRKRSGALADHEARYNDRLRVVASTCAFSIVVMLSVDSDRRLLRDCRVDAS